MINVQKIKEIATKFVVILIVAIASFLLGAFLGLRQSAFEPSISPNEEVRLNDVKVAWVPESEQVYFIDRKTNKVAYTLSKEVTTAVFSLKASAIQADFNNVTDGGVAPKRSAARNTSPSKLSKQAQQPTNVEKTPSK